MRRESPCDMSVGTTRRDATAPTQRAASRAAVERANETRRVGIDQAELVNRKRIEPSRAMGSSGLLQCSRQVFSDASVRPPSEREAEVGGEATERGQFRIRPTAAPQFY